MLRRSCVLLALLAAPLSAQLPPEKAAGSFAVSDGLEFKPWASEPLFTNPTCMDVDHKGRVWVVESVNYRNKLRNFKKLTRAEGDRIVILEDDKGEGRATKATTFYQSPEIMAPLGLAVAKDPAGPGYKVFVCQSPDLLVFTDKDGDGKADGPPTKLLTGFRGIDHDHGLHSVLIGPDLKLYFTVGDAGVAGLKGADGKGRAWTSNATDCRAGTVWRCELDGSKLELIAHNFRNNYEACVDSFGTVFLSDNDDDGNQQTRICHVIPGGDYGYHPRGKGETHWHEEQPGVMPKILRTYFGSPTGICLYEGGLLPEAYRGQLLHCDAGPRHVRAYRLRPKGASYEADREDVVQSADNWFRPSDVCVAPDGSVFVADWYDPGVGGHGMGDIKHGRVYRLAPKGDRSKTPAVDLTTDEGVLAALRSPNLATRYLAMARLAGMKPGDAHGLLLPAVKQKEDAVLRARALWQMARAARADGIPGVLSEPVTDPDPRFQVLALRMHRDFPASNLADLPSTVAAVARASKDPSVRRECLALLRDVNAEAAKPVLYELMKRYDGKDRHYLACLGIAVGTDPARRAAILADFNAHFPAFDEKVAGLVFELRPPGMAALLSKRLTDGSVAEGERAAIADVLAGSDDKEAAATLIGALKDAPPKVRDRILAGLDVNLPGKWKAHAGGKGVTVAIDGLLAAPATRSVGLKLIG
ncbi:MAG: PVC-type heme-binding CxxCH protein, partial [Gemmataceae bacterium]